MQGEMVQDNGTMIGGGTRVPRGKMRVGDAPPAAADPAAAKRDLQAAQAEVQAAETAVADAQVPVTREHLHALAVSASPLCMSSLLQAALPLVKKSEGLA